MASTSNGPRTDPEKPGEQYPPIEPYNHGWLRVSDLHEIYYEECGNKDGNPIVFLHGGPGYGCLPEDRQFFDPTAFRIILFDQRGAEKSRPFGEMRENTTWDLVSDMEKLREHLGVDKWVVFGGSWGSTLALTYSQTHPDSVKALILYSLCTFEREEFEWFYQKGASFLYPDLYDKLVEAIPVEERGDIIAAYHKRFHGNNKEEHFRCARVWTEYQIQIAMPEMSQDAVEEYIQSDLCLFITKMETNYMINGGWLKEKDQLLNGVDKIRHIPATIIHGKWDTISPLKTAWEFHKKWPEAELHMVPNAGHYHTEPGIKAKLMEACQAYKSL